MEAVCTRAIIIAKGRIVVDSTPAELAAMSSLHNAVTLKASGAQAGLDEQLKRLPGVAEVQVSTGAAGQSQYLIIPNGKRVILHDVTRWLEAQQVPFDEVYAERGHVDEVFRRVTTAASPEAAAR
jgi:ABC-2 type transport system ATP-binding protein